MPIDAVNQINYTQPIQKPKAGQENNNIDQPVDNKTNQKALIAVGAAVALASLGVLGYKGYLGEGIQKALGGAKKAAAEEGKEKTEEKAKEEIKKSIKELYEDAIKNKKTTLELNGRIHNFEYNTDGKLIKETVTKGDDYAIYENIDGKMKIVELKKNGKIVKKNLKPGSSHTPSRIPDIIPPQIFKGEIPKPLDKNDIPQTIKLSEDILNTLRKDGKYYEQNPGHSNIVYIYNSANSILRYETLAQKTRTIEFDVMGNIKSIKINTPSEDGYRIIQRNHYNPEGILQEIETLNYKNSDCNLRAFFDKDGKLKRYSALTKDGYSLSYNAEGEVITDHGITRLLDLI